jgi:hypothetical protein
MPTRRTAGFAAAGVLFLCLALAAVTGAAGAPPSNDDFANATPIAGLPATVAVDDCSGVEKDPAEPVSYAVWYSLSVDSDQQLELNLGFGEVAVYLGDSIDSLEKVDLDRERSNSLESPTGRPQVVYRLDAKAGTQYRLAVKCSHKFELKISRGVAGAEAVGEGDPDRLDLTFHVTARAEEPARVSFSGDMLVKRVAHGVRKFPLTGETVNLKPGKSTTVLVHLKNKGSCKGVFKRLANPNNRFDFALGLAKFVGPGGAKTTTAWTANPEDLKKSDLDEVRDGDFKC